MEIECADRSPRMGPVIEMTGSTRIPPRTRRRWVRRAGFLLILAGAAIYLRKPLFEKNFGVVDPGRAYRSAQPESDLEARIGALKLGSIVNLRGGSEADAFYQHEVATTERLAIEFYDLPMSATQRPSRRDLLRAIAVLDRCRYPLLIHCKWGSDRTGLMSALYLLTVRGQPPEAAIRAFTLAHGHVPLFGPQHLHEPIEEYALWLRDGGLDHTPERFRRWVERDYRADDPFTGWPSLRPGPRPIFAGAMHR